MNRILIARPVWVASAFAALIVTAVTAAPAQAQENNVGVLDYEGEFFTDLTKSIPTRQKVDISRKLRVAAQSSLVHPMLVVIDELATYPQMPQDIQKFAAELANQWQIGDQQTKQGVLVLFSLKDRKFFVAKTSNLPQSVSDAIAGAMMGRVRDSLQSNDVARAMSLAADVIAEHLSSGRAAATSPAKTVTRTTHERRYIDQQRDAGGPIGFGMGLICPFFVLAIFFVVITSIMSGSRRGYGRGYRGPYYGGGG